ncbi:MAG: VapC toxin family PIN domain ribonuclease [Syntrophus sp. (in: bacteria)]|nr:VapC toxin family PIN domain ribonuclease [Syntrophus sp. (in: bacteria)]
MILVDSSVWIDYFNGKKTSQTQWLDSALGNTPIIINDLILTEVLQGFQKDKDFKTARGILLSVPFMSMGGQALATDSAINYRYLRRKGVIVRKTIAVIIGTFCIRHQLTLLHDDRDFDPMVTFLGLEIIET